MEVSISIQRALEGGGAPLPPKSTAVSCALFHRECFPCRVALARRRICRLTALTEYIILSDIFSAAEQRLSAVQWSPN